MEKGKIELTQKDAENTPAGGVVVGKRDGQTMIYDDASLGGYFVGKLHKDGGIKMVNKSTGQPLEVQGSEVIITAPAVNDQTKREFEGKMMTNREILSKINSDGGGVSFADGGDIPAKIHTTDCEYKFGGKKVKDTDIAHSLGMNSTLKKGKQQFSSGDTTYDVDAIYNAIKKGKLRLKTKEVETFPMKYPVYDKNYAENHKIDFRKPNGITVRTESGEEVLIDGNHRMNNAYLKGRKTMKTYYIEDPKKISKFSKKNKFELGGENKMGGHLSSGKSLKQIAEMHNVTLTHINEELAKGLEVEKEHFADFKERTRVAKDHLVENPNYYTILEKAGLKRGGHLQKQELVKSSEKGDTPARDLNNYNDLLDVQADGRVGGESGIDMDGALVTEDAGAVNVFANGGIFPRVNHSDKLGKEFSYQGGKFLIVDFPNKQGAWNKGARFRGNTASHHTYLIKLDEVETDMDKNLFMKFEIPYFYNNDLDYWENFVGLPSVNSKGTVSKFLNERFFNFFPEDAKLADGGITPIDANIEGDSVDIVESDFAKGGAVYDTTKPKLEKVTIKETRFNRASVVGRNASNANELQDIILDYVRNSSEEIDWIKFYVNDATRGSYYIDLNKGKKNTVKNVNTETVNAQNIKRVIDAKDYLVKNYDWTDFFELGSKTTATASKGTTHNKVKSLIFKWKESGMPTEEKLVESTEELYNLLKEAYGLNLEDLSVQPLGYQLAIKPKPFLSDGIKKLVLDYSSDLAIKNINKYLYELFPDLNFDKLVRNSSNTPTTSTKTPLTKDELYNSRIWIGDDVNLKKKVIQKLEEIGIPFDNINGNPNADKSIDINIFDYDFVVYKESKEEFDKDTKRKEIFPSDLGISVSTPASNSTQLKELRNTKIWIGNNPELSEKIQKRAFQLGWGWGGTEKTIKYLSADSIYFDASNGMSYGDVGKDFFNNEKNKEVTEADILGSQTPNASIKKPKVERLYVENGASFSDIEKIRLFLDSTTIGNDEIYFYINPNGGGDYIRVEMKDSLSSMYYNRNAGLEPKYEKLREIFELNRAFENYDWEEFFSNVVSSSTTNSSTSASSQDDLVESVVINYQKPNGYIATNAEKLLDEIKRIWKEGGRSKMEITLQPQNVNGLINSPIYITLDTTTNAFTIEPSGVSLSELKDLLKRYYPLNWDKFFEVSAINISYNLAPYEASRVTLNWENLQGMAQTANFYTKDGSVGSGKGFISFLKDIEKNSNGKDVEVTIRAYAKDNNGNEFEKNDYFTIGENFFKPSTRTNEQIKSVTEEWIDGINFEKFFEDVIPLNATEKEKVIFLSLISDSGGYINVSNISELKERIETTFTANRGNDERVSLYANGLDGSVFIIMFGDNRTCEICYDTLTDGKERIKDILLSYEDSKNYDWSDFFEEAQTPTTQYKPINLSQTKIWFGNDVEVSKQIQERAFELGWSWKTFTSPITPNYVNSPALYFHSDNDISYGDDRELFDSNKDFREITFKDLFEKIEPASRKQNSNISGSLGSVQEITDFKEAVGVLEGIASQASQKYNTNKYDENLGLLKEVKEEYELALSFTPESSFMYERIELMKKITEIQKEITRITELKNGGAFYILSKVIERLDKGEDWKQLGNGEIMVNEVPPQEIDAVIYTEKFKNWFGDWEKALVTKEYDYVSKALTENGKPCVMYHGAKRIKYSYRQVSNGVLYLAENRSYAEWFSANESPFQKEGDYLTQCFVNIKNPIDLTPFGVEEVDLRDIIQYIDTLYPLAKIYDVLNPLIAKEIIDNNLIGANVRAWNIIRQYPELNTHIRENTNYDGFIYYENNPSDKIFNDQTGQLEDRITKATAVFKSSQVKLVDAMLFDGSLDDWRFEKGGKVN